jgi:hypothetical protein
VGALSKALEKSNPGSRKKGLGPSVGQKPYVMLALGGDKGIDKNRAQQAQRVGTMPNARCRPPISGQLLGPNQI